MEDANTVSTAVDVAADKARQHAGRPTLAEEIAAAVAAAVGPVTAQRNALQLKIDNALAKVTGADAADVTEDAARAAIRNALL